MTNDKPFSSARYVTRGVSQQVPLVLQLALWQIIDERKERGDVLDYLQVFELSIEWKDGEPLQKVLNRQEEPSLEVAFFVKWVETPLNAVTIWVVDSDSYSTMMFPSEW
ncbi:DUF960 family protein [uncultured Brevibacillus sp.]|uniref:DUF960 family protein n=1 Tax=uncultured Brevibacillus sp. TaxID=169970 RepID=UPI00259842C3|nr:DUF960 family protein [uncultured Brevibacillus sp.]